MIRLAISWVNHPEVGCVQAQVTLDHAQDATQKHSFYFNSIAASQHPAGESLIVLRNVLGFHQTDRPVLHRLGHRWDRVLTHRRERVDRRI